MTRIHEFKIKFMCMKLQHVVMNLVIDHAYILYRISYTPVNIINLSLGCLNHASMKQQSNC